MGINYLTVNMFHPGLNDLYTQSFLQMECNPDQRFNVVVVDSPGGYVWNLSVLLDLIQDSCKPTITIASGIVASCGACLATAGTPGLRIIGANTKMLIHEASGSVYGKTSDIVAEAKEIQNTTDEIVYGTFDRNSCRPKGYTQSLIKEINNADLWLSADEAIEHRFSDIKMSRGKALLSLNDIYDGFLERKTRCELGVNADFPFEGRKCK